MPDLDQAFTRQLGSELQRVLSRQGFQSLTLPPWGVPPAYSSPSQPLHIMLRHIIHNFRDIVKPFTTPSIAITIIC